MTVYASKAKAEAAARATKVSYKKPHISGLKLDGAEGGAREGTILARWKCSLTHIDHFNIDWEYWDTKTNRWYQGNNGTKSVNVSSKAGGYYQDELSITSLPATVNRVRARVKAVSKDHKVTMKYSKTSGKKTTTESVSVTVKYWTAGYTSFHHYTYYKRLRPAVPDAPSAELLDTGGVKVSWGGFERPTTCIVVDRYSKADGYAPGTGRRVAPNSPTGTHQPASVFQNSDGGSFIDLAIAAGCRYRYMCRAHDYDGTGDKTYSKSAAELVQENNTSWWLQSCLSAEVQTRPLDPMNQAASYYGMNGDKARVKVSWKDNGYAGDSYEVRYAKSLDLLKLDGGYETYSPDLVFTGGGAQKECLVDVDPGETWFFRVVVENSNSGEMGYSAFGRYASCMAGERPSAPTLSDMEPYYAVGDVAQALWTHNAPDKSEQVAAQVEVTVAGANLVSSGYIEVADVELSADGTFALPPDFSAFAQNQVGASCWDMYDEGTTLSVVMTDVNGRSWHAPVPLSEVTVDGLTATVDQDYWNDGINYGGRYASGKIASLRYHTSSEVTVHDVEGATSSFAVDLANVPADSVVTVRVRTKGAHPDWSDWSSAASFTVLAPPQCYITAAFPNSSYDPEDENSQEQVTLSDEGTLRLLPLSCSLTAGGTDNQTPVSWFLEVVAAGDFPYTDSLGNDALMISGTQMMAVTVDATVDGFDSSLQEIVVTAADGAFASGGEYMVRAFVVTDAGLQSEYATLSFSCEWSYDLPAPSIDGYFEDQGCTMALTPACYREVYPDGYDPMDDQDGEVEPGYELVGDATLDVYRINYDGSLTAIAEGVANTGDVVLVDKYPTFGECSYRVVANDPHTDAMSVLDTQPIPTPVYGLFIQWDEERYAGFDEESQSPVYEGESVLLPWNNDVDEDADPDRELVGYIGRENPVAYFGTQLGISGKWTSEIFKFDDADLLAQLRKLQRWQGTCYVRETSGVGYRAVVGVSFGRSHDSGTIPVSIEVTKVEEE